MNYYIFLILFHLIYIIQVYCQDGDLLQPQIACPRGWYHDIINSPTLVSTNECLPCARGKYGSKSGLTSPECSGLCPSGRYGDKWAATSEDDCTLCPAGTFGEDQGLVLKTCSGFCPIGKYGRTVGAKSDSSCIECPQGYKSNKACQNRDSILLHIT